MSRSSVVGGEVNEPTVAKNKFSQLNNKRICFSNGIVSLTFCHPILAEIDDFKQKKDKKIEKYFWYEKEESLRLENNALKNMKDCTCTTNFNICSKNFNINQKFDLTQQNKSIFK